MSLQFNRVNGSTEIRKASMQDITFAKHALAVIRVHDSQVSDGSMTLRQIAAKDEYLHDKVDALDFYALCAFGRHLEPVYTKFLDTYCSEGYAAEIDLIVGKLRSI